MLKESNLSLQRNWQMLIKPEQLDIEFGSDAGRVATALRTGIGAMPSYQATLSEAQIVRLSRYVAKASGGAR